VLTLSAVPVMAADRSVADSLPYEFSMDFSILKENPRSTCAFAECHPWAEALAFGPAAGGLVYIVSIQKW
jgi:hypothetical protein